MPDAQGIAHREAVALRKLEVFAKENGSEDQLEQFHRHRAQPTYGQEGLSSLLTLEAAADLVIAASGTEYEEDKVADESANLSYNPETGEVEPKKASWERVAEVQTGQGPIPEDAEAGDSLSDSAAEGNEADSEVSEEDREALNQDSEELGAGASDEEAERQEAESEEESSEAERQERPNT